VNTKQNLFTIKASLKYFSAVPFILSIIYLLSRPERTSGIPPSPYLVCFFSQISILSPF
jgi:hypothetical protein